MGDEVGMNNSIDDEDDKPLDPAAERIQRKLRRLMLISALTLGVGMIAVFSAIIYRVVKSGEIDLPIYASGELLIPAGAKVISAGKDGDFIAVTLETPDGSEVYVMDLRTLTVINRIKFVPEVDTGG
jgi:hypothetical protein